MRDVYKRQMVQGRLQYDEFYALKDVSLDIMPGDFYGLVGLNGSGKSTLRKTIACVYKPSKGKAVSYTHLDVYKRQLVVTGGLAKYVAPLCRHPLTYDPDVYKRQG